ncbi:MAG TPA: nuclear transport factor 2 family protein [Propionicimonas sp.]|nr:nuclear transport factor 2 family protein [Propionicimonas sp.]
MNIQQQVLAAARQRAAALAEHDQDRLRELLHPDLRWTSHTGERFDRDAYLRSNTGGSNRWSSQQLVDAEVVVHDETAVLRCLAVDTVDRGGGAEEFRMPMTQVWVRRDGGWVCLAGHAGPRLGEHP